MKIDWELLRKQKEWLMQFNREEADGLLSLIDAIQDNAVNSKEFTEEEIFGRAV